VQGDLSQRLRASLTRQEELLRCSLVLNPVDTFPFPEDLAVTAGPLHGLYNTDKQRDRAARIDTPIQFAGRQTLESDSRTIYDAWAHALRAADATLRLLSGLPAHIVLFMAMARPGQTVLLLPVEARRASRGARDPRASRPKRDRPASGWARAPWTFAAKRIGAATPSCSPQVAVIGRSRRPGGGGERRE
jgi:hypothetical protein